MRAKRRYLVDPAAMEQRYLDLLPETRQPADENVELATALIQMAEKAAVNYGGKQRNEQ